MLKPRYSNYNLECGVDEAGRGCLAGPVTAAAVILKSNFKHDLIDDSKKLSKIKKNFREIACFVILVKSSLIRCMWTTQMGPR